MTTRAVVEGRLSYPHLLEPRAISEGSPKKYSVTIVIPKKDTAAIEVLRAAEAEAFENGVSGVFKGKRPKRWLSSIKDADVDTNRQGEVLAELNPPYEGCFVLHASSNERFKPSLVDEEFNDVLDPKVVYPGVGAKCAVNFFPYSVNGNVGVAAGLNAVMITDTTLDSFSGAPNVRALFGAPDKDEVALD